MKTPTLFVLMAEHDARTTLTVEEVGKHYWDMSPKYAQRLAREGRFPVTCFKLDDSRKSPWVVLLTDLGHYLDTRRDKAVQEYNKLNAPPHLRKSFIE